MAAGKDELAAEPFGGVQVLFSVARILELYFVPSPSQWGGAAGGGGRSTLCTADCAELEPGLLDRLRLSGVTGVETEVRPIVT